MSRIEMSIEEYQDMKNKIKRLEDALNLVSKDAATYKEKIEKAKALLIDLENEGLINRLFAWKNIFKPLKNLFNKTVKNT